MKSIKLSFVCLIIFGAFEVCPAQPWQWARHNGSSFFDGVANIVVDDSGNTYYSGSFQGNYCYFTNDTSWYCQGDNDFFLIKYDANGNEIWWRQFGIANPSGCREGVGGLVLKNNYLYLTGGFCNSINFGGIILSGPGEEFYLAKYDLNGNCIWAKNGGGPGTSGGTGVAVDDSGDIYVCGANSGQAVYDSDTVAAGGFIAKYDDNGNLSWIKKKFRYLNININTEMLPTELEFFNSRLFVWGVAVNDTLVIDTITIYIPMVAQTSFLGSFDSNGDVLWAKVIGGNSANSGFDFSVDSSGNSFVTGVFYGSGYFDNDTLSGGTSGDVFLARYDINGNKIWVRQLNCTNGGWGWCTSATPGDGSTYITGYFSGNATFGAYNITANATKDMFLARYDANGTCLGVRTFGYAEGHGVAQDAIGNPYVCGIFRNTVTIGTSTFTSHGIDDIFVAKCDVFTGLGEGERAIDNRLHIYANPNSGKCTLSVPDELANERYLELRIFDNSGRLLQQKTLEMHDGTIKVNLEAEAKGVYQITLGNGEKQYSGTIVFE